MSTATEWVDLTEREAEVLRALDDQAWLRPMDIGAHSRSHHAVTLKRLIKKGLVERKRRNSLMNAMGFRARELRYVYRRTKGRATS